MVIDTLLGDRILVSSRNAESKTKSGIILFNTAPIAPYVTGEIVQTGTMLKDHTHLKAGKFCKFRRGTGEQYNDGENDYLIMRSTEVYLVGDTENIKICASPVCYTVLLAERLLCLPCKEENKTQGGIMLLPGADLLKALIVIRGVDIIQNNYLGVDDNDFVFYRRGSGLPYPEENDKGDMVNYIILNREEILLAE